MMPMMKRINAETQAKGTDVSYKNQKAIEERLKITCCLQDIEETSAGECLQECEFLENVLDLQLSPNDRNAKDSRYYSRYPTKMGQGMRKNLSPSRSLILMTESTLITTRPALREGRSTQ